MVRPFRKWGACLPTNKENKAAKVSEQTIAERKQAEQANDREIFRSMTNMFAALDTIYFPMELTYDELRKPVDGIFLEVNPATERLLGKSKGQLIGRSRQARALMDRAGFEPATSALRTRRSYRADLPAHEYALRKLRHKI